MNLNYFKEINFTPKRILDIGCNVGQFYFECKSQWENIDITLIDGNSYVEEDIKKLNVPYYIEVLSDGVKNVTWYSTSENRKNTGDSYYKENSDHYSTEKLITIEKTTTTLDILFPTSQFDLIKIDTQGSEIDIIIGGLNLCEKSKYIILETSLIEWNLDSPYEDQVTGFMESIGFSFVAIVNHHMLAGEVIQHDILYKNKHM